MKPMDIAIEAVGFAIRMGLAFYVLLNIDFECGRVYEQAMGFGMVFLLMNSDTGGKA